MKLTVIVLFMCLIASIRSDSNRRTSLRQNQRSVHIDPPNIEALTPKGLRVSLPHIDGMQLFAFHAKINSPIRRTESGNIARDITHPVNGYWTFEDRDIQLRIGDVINYWIFVEVNGMGYRLDNLSKIIRELAAPHIEETYHSSSSSSSSASSSSLSSSSSGRKRTSTTDTRPVECNCDLSELKTITTQLNVTLMQVNNLNNKLIPMQLQVESLTELLLELIKDQNIGTQLLLVGQEPPGRNPVEAVRQLITDKLELVDLENRIQQAHSTEDGIYFEMSSPVDKKRILFRAGQRLDDANYQIVDPALGRTGNHRQPYITAAMVRMGGDSRTLSNRNREDDRTSSISENSYSDRNRDRTTTMRPTLRTTRRQNQESSFRREQDNVISLSRSNNRGTQYNDDVDDDDEDRLTFSGNGNRQGSRITTSDRLHNSNSRRSEQSGYELGSVQTSNERYIRT